MRTATYSTQTLPPATTLFKSSRNPDNALMYRTVQHNKSATSTGACQHIHESIPHHIGTSSHATMDHQSPRHHGVSTECPLHCQAVCGTHLLPKSHHSNRSTLILPTLLCGTSLLPTHAWAAALPGRPACCRDVPPCCAVMVLWYTITPSLLRLDLRLCHQCRATATAVHRGPL